MKGRPDLDVLVVGGGPAGLAVALQARARGLSVLVAEPREAPIDKACGEGLMPGGLTELHRLGVEVPGVPFAGIAYLDNHGRRGEARFRDGPGRGVRRTVLHAAMHEAADRAGTQWTSKRISTVEQHDHHVVAGGITARWLVAADGLHSSIRRGLGITASTGGIRRYGLRRHWQTSAWSDCVEVWWSPDAEAYVTPVAEDLIGVAILTRRTALSYRELLAGFPALRERLADPVGPVRGAGPLRQRVSARVRGRVLLAGDAAGYEDALTGEGVSLALKQAGLVMDAIESGKPQSYEQSWRRLTRDYRWLTRALVLATANRPMRSLMLPACLIAPGVFRGAVNILAK